MNILCPFNSPCVDDTASLGNYSSEDPDRNLFRSTYFPNAIWDDDFEIWRACFGLCVSEISQEDADLCAQNNAKICELGKQRGNKEVTCSRTCPDGSIQTKTIPAETFWAETQAQADALASEWCNKYLGDLCGSLGPKPGPTPNGNLPPPSGQRASNDQQANTAPCLDGGRGGVVPAGTVWAANKRAANARAISLLGNGLVNYIGCLTPFPKTVCLDEDLGQKFVAPDKVAGLRAPYTWSVFGVVPPGVVFTATGLAMRITGRFTVQGTFAFRLTLTDFNGSYVYRNYTVSVMEINQSDTLPNATQDAPYSHAISVVGGTDPKVFSLVSGYTLPAGLSLDQETGVLSGEPENYGTTAFKIRVTDKYLASCEKEFNLTVLPNLFGSIVWTLTSADTPPGYGFSTGLYGDVSLGAVTPAGILGGGGSAGASTLWSCNNLTGSPINCQLRVEAVNVNKAPPAAGGMQLSASDYFMFHVETATVIANNGGVDVDTGTYTFPFTIPVGISTWQISFLVGCSATGPPFDGGSITWGVHLEYL
jgi:hypothetical protein